MDWKFVWMIFQSVEKTEDDSCSMAGGPRFRFMEVWQRSHSIDIESPCRVCRSPSVAWRQVGSLYVLS